MMVKKTILVLLLLSGGFILKAQENTHFSQGIFNQAFVNPAYAGSVEQLFQATGVVRTEMVGFDGSPTMTMLNVNGPIEALHGGVSLSISNDKMGYFTMPSVNVGYAFRFPIWEGNLAFGLSAGLVNSNIKQGQWRYPDGSGSTDGAIPTQDQSSVSPDFGVGAYYNNEKLFIGLSCMHLTGTNITKTELKSQLPRVVYAMAGYRILFRDPNFEFRPSAYVSSDFTISHYTLNGHLFYKNKVWGGLSYRFNEAVVGTIGFELFGGVKIGYSYDFVTSKARLGSKGAHEILLNYNFTVSTEKKRQQYRSVRYL